MEIRKSNYITYINPVKMCLSNYLYALSAKGVNALWFGLEVVGPTWESI